jgi:hypothetical protein
VQRLDAGARVLAPALDELEPAAHLHVERALEAVEEAHVRRAAEHRCVVLDRAERCPGTEADGDRVPGAEQLEANVVSARIVAGPGRDDRQAVGHGQHEH